MSELNKIQFTSGCPNQCSYCYEPKEVREYYPEIPEGNDLVQILDMNFLVNHRKYIWLDQLKAANNKHYEFICGVDFRLLTQEICYKLKESRFIKIRWAWDYGFSQQKVHQKVWRMFKKAGYKSESLSVFILVNWRFSYIECLKKLDLLKVWNVKVNDCCFDGGYKQAAMGFWDPAEIKDFRKRCRKHNQMVLFKIDPELKQSRGKIEL